MANSKYSLEVFIHTFNLLEICLWITEQRINNGGEFDKNKFSLHIEIYWKNLRKIKLTEILLVPWTQLLSVLRWFLQNPTTILKTTK